MTRILHVDFRCVRFLFSFWFAFHSFLCSLAKVFHQHACRQRKEERTVYVLFELFTRQISTNNINLYAHPSKLKHRMLLKFQEQKHSFMLRLFDCIKRDMLLLCNTVLLVSCLVPGPNTSSFSTFPFRILLCHYQDPRYNCLLYCSIQKSNCF